MARFDPEPLRRLAATGGGEYSSITAGDEDLDRVLSAPNPATVFHKAAAGGVQRWIEQGVWLLPLLLLIGASGFRRGWLAVVVVIAVLPPPADAFEWRDLWLRPDQQAAEALQTGRAGEAARQFTDPAWRGMALYRSGDYDAAAQAFGTSGSVDADYNRGNALAHAGRLPEAADAYRSVLKQAPDYADAKANLALVERLLQQQHNQTQDRSQNQSQNQNQNQNQDQKQDRSARNERQTSPQQQQQQDSRAGNQGQGRDGQDSGPSSGDEKKDNSAEPRQASAEPARPDDTGANDAAHDMTDTAQVARRDVAGESSTRPGARKDLAPDSRDEVSDKPTGEAAVALEQWLRQIPEDPSGLLRRKFMLDHLRREQEGQ